MRQAQVPRSVPRPHRVGPFSIDWPYYTKRGYNLHWEDRPVEGSFATYEAALMACGMLLADPAFALPRLRALRDEHNALPEWSGITVEELVRASQA